MTHRDSIELFRYYFSASIQEYFVSNTKSINSIKRPCIYKYKN